MSQRPRELGRRTVGAVAALGSEAEVELLVGLLAAKSEELKKTAQASLVKLPGAGTSKVWRRWMEQQELPQRIVLMDVLVARKAGEAVPGLLAAALDDNSELRGAAVKALGQLGFSRRSAGFDRGGTQGGARQGTRSG